MEIRAKKVIIILNSGKVMVVSYPKFLNLGDSKLEKENIIKEKDLADFLKGEVLMIKSGKADMGSTNEYHEIKVSQISAITFEVE